uniref:5'-3' exonuclease alpha-helical arch N-terminal domain-containing protein n=1 Tax=Aegilops tauschii subsp. strangulata TaxID=200361 RepID=A0A453IJU9_AEGTS
VNLGATQPSLFPRSWRPPRHLLLFQLPWLCSPRGTASKTPCPRPAGWHSPPPPPATGALRAPGPSMACCCFRAAAVPRLLFRAAARPLQLPLAVSRKSVLPVTDSVESFQGPSVDHAPRIPLYDDSLPSGVSTILTNPGENVAPADPSKSRIMLVDGTSVMYRSYYKILAQLQHGQLEHADGNGDWVLTIFKALSLLLDMLEFLPSHVAVCHFVLAWILLAVLIYFCIFIEKLHLGDLYA